MIRVSRLWMVKVCAEVRCGEQWGTYVWILIPYGGRKSSAILCPTESPNIRSRIEAR